MNAAQTENKGSAECRRVPYPLPKEHVVQPGDFSWSPERQNGIIYLYVCLPGDTHLDALRCRRGPSTGDAWGWDGNEEKPTLTPSIHWPGHWHGYLRAGAAGILSMRLTDLDPRWVGLHNFDENAIYHIGITFDSPTTGKRLAVMFKPAIDPAGLAVKYGWPDFFPDKRKWDRTGDSFETLTLAPSLDFSQHGEWHGFITAGQIS